MIDKEHELPQTHQARLLDLSRGCLYYQPTPISQTDLDLMRTMDMLHLEHPNLGARGLRDHLRLRGIWIGRRHVARLMRIMGIEALFIKKATSRRNPAHPVYPYLLRHLVIDRPNQVWAADITYIPMRRGFLYFFAVMDWSARRILAWRLSNTLTVDFCIEAVEEAIALYGTPEIFNVDQGSQFTGVEFVDLLTRNNIRISMDGKGAWRDNVFIERFWKTLKYEEVYLHAYDSGSEAKAGLGNYVHYYNYDRPHSSLGGRTPDMAYRSALAADAA
jgi:putative transposase